MSPRFLCTALVLVIACLVPAVVRADEVHEVEKLFKTGQVEQALQQADATITQQPRAARMRFLKGMLLTDLGRNDEAIEVFVALTQDYPELADPYNNLAVLYAAQGRLQAALTALQAALRNDPQHLAARENLGDVHLALALQAWDTATKQTQGEDARLLRKLEQAQQIAPPQVLKDPSRRRR